MEQYVGLDVPLRGGLPFDTQLEFNLPYNQVDQENVNNVAVAISSRSGTGWGLGDLSLGVAKTVLREKNWWPDLITRFTWSGKRHLTAALSGMLRRR